MLRFTRSLLLATCLVCVGAVAGMAQMDGPEGEHEGPPILILVPPPDAEKPEGLEMSEDPEESFRQLFDAFFQMMDQDGNGELNHDEMAGWVHPPHRDGGEGMGDGDGMGDGGDMGEHVRHLEEELRRVHEEQHRRHIEELTHHRDRIREELGHMREEQARMAEHMRQMEEDARRTAEELERALSEPPPGEGPPPGDEG